MKRELFPRRVAHIAAWALLCLAVFSPAAMAQPSNPPLTACGLPAGGSIWSAVTYNLSADCDLTSTLQTPGTNGFTVTINGNGYTIKPSSVSPHNRAIWLAHADSRLVMNNVTIDGSAVSNVSLLHLLGTADLDKVSFKASRLSTALYVGGDSTLDSVLFENNSGGGYSSNQGASAFRTSGDATLTNTVARGNLLGSAALRADSGGSLTFEGCLTFSGNVPQDTSGSATDNSGGTACSGTIGNGDSAALAAPTPLACGLPGRGQLNSSQTYSMTSSCDYSGETMPLWMIAEDASITINGNGHSLTGVSATSVGAHAGYDSTLTMNDLNLSSFRIWHWGTLSASAVRITNMPSYTLIFGDMSLSNSIVENNPKSVVMTISQHGGGDVTIKDTIFSNNTATDDLLRATFGGSITLSGCISDEGNTGDLYDTSDSRISDNSTGSCARTGKIGPPLPALASPAIAPEPESGPPLPHCYQPLGALGVICREHDKPSRGIQVWESGADGSGHMLLSLTPERVNAAANESLIASSPDGRSAAYVTGPRCIIREKEPRVHSPDCIAGQLTSLRQGPGERIDAQRFVIVSLGVTSEGKVHSAVFDENVYGHVIGTVDTFTGLPGIPKARSETAIAAPPARIAPSVAPNVTAQAPQADGSILHSVQPGDTIYAIGVAYNVSTNAIIRLNQLVGGGRLIFPGQNLLVKTVES